MPLTRFASWTLLAGAGFALLTAAPSPARQDKKDEPPRPPNNYYEMSGLKGAVTIPPEKMAAAKVVFKSFAQYNAEYIQHPKVYSAPQEFRPEILLPGTPPPPNSLDVINSELARHIFVPLPAQTQEARVTPDKLPYIQELGVELDAALSKVIKDAQSPIIVQINATRLLATACKSGAKAHYPTVTELVANPNYPLEIKNYAYQAAANLLAAYDCVDYRSRNHSHTDKKVVGALVKALEDAIFPPAELVKADPKKKVEEPTSDQLAVIGFVRRNAVRALAQFRFASFDIPNAGTLYPAHTLARVAMSDPALVPPPSPSEVAEAVMGLCNMGMTKGLNPDLIAEAVGLGLVQFSRPRAGHPLDQTIAWRVYAARLADSLKTWGGMYDNGYDPARPYVINAASVPKSVEAIAQNGLSKLLVPMDKVDANGKPDVTVKVDLNGMEEVVNRLRAAPTRPATLFRDVPTTSLGAAPPKQ